jgi:hypothetical protein
MILNVLNTLIFKVLIGSILHARVLMCNFKKVCIPHTWLQAVVQQGTASRRGGKCIVYVTAIGGMNFSSITRQKQKGINRQ